MQLERQIKELQARLTDRGLIVTLADGLFAAGMAHLKASAMGEMNKLLAFLEDHPARTIVIEGHKDVLGERGYNRGLSQRRADAVKSFLTARGLSSSRVTASGDAASDPLASDPPQDGRGRGVEVIIVNPVATLL